MNSLPLELENIIINYKEQIEAFGRIENTDILIKGDCRKRARLVKYSELYKLLENGKDNTCYEFITNDNMVKPYIDYEYIGDNIEEVKEKVLNELCIIFKSKREEWAISTSSRKIDNYTKNTIHFVLWTRKIQLDTLRDLIFENLFQIAYLEDTGDIDTCAYRGMSIFRTPMTVKQSYKGNNDRETYLKPDNYTTYEEFHKHIVTLTTDL